MAKNAENGRLEVEERGISNTLDVLRRAFAEFLIIPTCIIACFLLLALVTYQLDLTEGGPFQSVREFLKSRVFADAQATADLLGVIAAGIITMTSITISLLLVAVQQTAGSMTGAVLDQFLRRRINQFYFGFFVGLALYSLVTLATVNEPFFIPFVRKAGSVDLIKPHDLIELRQQFLVVTDQQQRRAVFAANLSN